MNNYLDIVDGRWSFGSYYRRQFLDDTLYTCCFYKDLEFILDRSNVAVRDVFAQELSGEGAVEAAVAEHCRNQTQRFLDQLECYDQWSLEQIYGHVHSIRKQYLGAGTIEKAYIRKARLRREMGRGAGIDQGAVMEELLENSPAVIFCLADPEYFRYLEEDLGRAAAMGKETYVIAGSTAGDTLLTREALEDAAGGPLPAVWLEDKARYSGLDLSAVRGSERLEGQILDGEAFLVIYGDDGLFHGRNLNIPAIVRTVPSCYYSRAMAGQFVGHGLCTVYVPPHFDILPWVPLREKTRVSYRQLAEICADHGRDIYRLGLDELYCRYPEYFVNIYGEGGGEMLPVRMKAGDPGLRAAQEYPAAPGLPAAQEYPAAPGLRAAQGYPAAPGLPAAQDLGHGFYGDYCRRREDEIAGYLNSVPGIRYISAYIDGETMEEIPVPWGCGSRRDGVLVQGAVVSQASGSRVILSDGGARSPRELVAEGDEDGLMLISNFLFFLTPKLAAFYNELRRERPWEQIEFDGGHLDYMLRCEGERRIETFPLYRKACIAMKADGSFLFFRFLLGGGRIELGGEAFSWKKEDVNPQSSEGDICVYTPYRAKEKVEEKADDYCETVGEGRFNLVIIQDRVICARLGDVVMPSIGVVFSLSAMEGLKLADDLKLEKIGDGYYRCGEERAVVCLDPPQGIRRDEWEQVRWAYGGGMSLISQGEGIYENGFPEEWLKDEGWLGPLSRQTQESEIHRPSRHPRTAVGVTGNGELFVLVYSGRIPLSRGADYGEMSRIARKLVPGVRHMMNVDGGGSAVLGMAQNRVFMELSYPATSYSSPAGMVRQINTILCIKR